MEGKGVRQGWPQDQRIPCGKVVPTGDVRLAHLLTSTPARLLWRCHALAPTFAVGNRERPWYRRISIVPELEWNRRVRSCRWCTKTAGRPLCRWWWSTTIVAACCRCSPKTYLAQPNGVVSSPGCSLSVVKEVAADMDITAHLHRMQSEQHILRPSDIHCPDLADRAGHAGIGMCG